MAHYDNIFIICNPKSTGASIANGEELARELHDGGIGESVRVILTEHAGHAEELAYSLALASKRPLIISSSGDGGYHEVINGALRAQAEGGQPTCGLLPSGNANDHYHNLHREPLADQILDGKHQFIDILELDARHDGQPWRRYAHSYIGLGLTSQIGHELNRARPNRPQEAWIVLRTLWRLRGSRLVVRGQERAYDSLIFSNVGRMSKILSLSDTAMLTDGKFEVISFPARGRLRLLRQLFKASTTGLHSTRRAERFEFATIRPLRVQLDGEVYRLDGLAKVHVRLHPGLLRCII